MGAMPSIIWFIGALVLAGSALAAQRAPLGFMVKSAIAWVAIILVVAALVMFFAPGDRTPPADPPPPATTHDLT